MRIAHQPRRNSRNSWAANAGRELYPIQQPLPGSPEIEADHGQDEQRCRQDQKLHIGLSPHRFCRLGPSFRLSRLSDCDVGEPVARFSDSVLVRYMPTLLAR